MTPSQIKHMVERFLSWKLPEDFHPDGNISFTGPNNRPTDTNLFTATQTEAMLRYMLDNRPTGTNLFTATQTETMLRYMLDGLPED